MEPATEVEQGKIPTDDGTFLCVYRLGSGKQTVILPDAVHLLEHFAHLGEEFTLIAYDPRNRGRSATISDPNLLRRGIHHDVEDLDVVRRYFKVAAPHVIGHGYLGVMAIVYAIAYPDNVARIVQIAPTPPQPDTRYAPQLMAADLAAAANSPRAQQIQSLRQQGVPEADPKEFCLRWWEFMREFLVADPERGKELGDHFCEFENEWPVNLDRHLGDNIRPSLVRLDLGPEQMQEVAAPVLTVHGTADRNEPYGGGRDWALRLPEARLLTVAGAAHLPHLEEPALVMTAIKQFLGGTWPAAAEAVTEI